jgi:alpha-galactosidase
MRTSEALKMADIRTDTALAVRMSGAADAEGFPPERAWETAPPIFFNADWQGKNADRRRETQVRILWNPEFLFVRFDAFYRTLTVFDDSEPSGRRDQLWDRDVCEAFLQPPGSAARSYKEIEVAPNGFWIDLEIAPGEKYNLNSGLRRRVNVDQQNKQWHAVLALPMKSLVMDFQIPTVWGVNFFRVEGASEPRFYSAWRPTNTPQPNFHVPEAFGALVFTEAASKIRS